MTIEIKVTNNGNRNAVIHEVTESGEVEETYITSHNLAPNETNIWDNHFLKIKECLN